MKNWKAVGRKLVKVAAFALMAVMVFVGGVTASELLRKEEPQPIGGVHTGNSLQAEQTTNNGISLMAADGTNYVGNTLGESVPYGALSVTATVTPVNATNQKLSWNFAWAGTTSSWSSGKTVGDYFSLEYVGTNAHEIYVWAKQPFGDQITVTATSTDGTNKTASMTVDFARRMNGLTELYISEGASVYIACSFDCSTRTADWPCGYRMEPGPIVEDFAYTASYTDGTKNLTWNLVDFSMHFDDELRQSAEDKFGMSTREYYTYSEDGGGYASMVQNMWEVTDIDSFWHSREESGSLWNEWVTSMNYGADLGDLTFYFESASTDSLGNKYTYSITFSVYGDFSAELPVSSVALSDSMLTI